ncbi:MAG TPA: CHAP domain-containing protein [Chthoniobacter sp.]|jgi:hypothetical protein
MMMAVLAFAGGHSAHGSESSRTWRWTTNDGRTFKAKFVRLQSTALVVAKGRIEFKVPIFELSPKSVELAKKFAKKRPPSAVPIGPVLAATHPDSDPGPSTEALPAIVPASLPPVAAYSVGPSILAFCRENVGKKIGIGQCATLAEAALKDAGAAPRGADWPGEGDYVWGDPVAFIQAGFSGLKGMQGLGRVEPGDIIQFHSARFSGFDHGQDGVYRYEMRHHTAVVESVDSGRKTITVLHQNWNGHQFVRRQTLPLRGMTSGWLRIYHPVASPAA